MENVCDMGTTIAQHAGRQPHGYDNYMCVARVYETPVVGGK